MPHFEGDIHGNPTAQDAQKAAEWLLEQDRLKESARRSYMFAPSEPLKGYSPAAETTIKEIEAELPGHLKAKDRELIRAIILSTPNSRD